MKSSNQFRATVLVCAATFSASALLVACGGGGGSAAVAGGGAVTPVAATLSGTAAIGRPYPDGTVISVFDSTNTQVATTTISSGDGSYSVVVPATAVAPLVISASADGEETLYSVAPTLTTGTLNVTPLTNLIAARLSPTGDPAQLASEIQATPAIASSTKVTEKVDEVKIIISSVTGVASDTTNPLTGSFAANGSGHDRVLDALKITVQPTGTSSNIQISVPNVADAGGQPVVLPIVAGGTSATAVITTAPPALASVTTAATAALPVVGVSTQIAALQSRVAECFALPKASRTSWTGTGTGLPADITAAKCKDIFYSNDPATYKNNSYTVASNNSWKSIYTKDDAVTVTYDKGSYLYTIKNTGQPNHGDVVYLSNWKAVNTAGELVGQGTDEHTTRADSTGKLAFIGNQSNWDVSVEARTEFRDFTHADFSKYSYKNVGYNLYVKNTNNITSVVVTSPDGKTLTLKPVTGLGFLGLTKSNGTVTGTSVVRMAAQFVNPSAAIGQSYTPTGSTTAVTVASPADIDTTLFWANPQWRDAEIAALPSQGTWSFDFTLTNGTTFTTKRRAINRAPTMAEANKVLWPSLTTATRTDLVSQTTGGGYLFAANGLVDISALGNLSGWTVPTGAWSPTSAKAYGRDTANANTSFDDESSFSATTRKTIIYCSDQDGAGTADQHCVGNQFKAGVGIGQIQLNGKDSRRLALSLSINTRKN